jgi:hypothetical protein
MHKKDLQRFHGSYIVALASKCWLWTGTRTPQGYGKFCHGPAKDRTQWLAHRLSWTLANGEIPEGMVLDHLCRNPACVNPDHLEPVTIGENVLRGEGIAAQHKRKTHCKRGHALTEDNLYPAKRGRVCKECHRMRQRNYNVTAKDKQKAYMREYYKANRRKLIDANLRRRREKAEAKIASAND